MAIITKTEATATHTTYIVLLLYVFKAIQIDAIGLEHFNQVAQIPFNEQFGN
jgi:hypothetical protein